MKKLKWSPWGPRGTLQKGYSAMILDFLGCLKRLVLNEHLQKQRYMLGYYFHVGPGTLGRAEYRGDKTAAPYNLRDVRQIHFHHLTFLELILNAHKPIYHQQISADDFSVEPRLSLIRFNFTFEFFFRFFSKKIAYDYLDNSSNYSSLT